MTPAVDLRRAGSRAHTQLDWLDSWHSFSFGDHVDRANTHFGLLIVSNDDRVTGGGGFGMHTHQDMEIVTWVLSGRLVHEDSEGNRAELYPGLAQRMSAGTGIAHSEANASATEEVHFVQMWVLPDSTGGEPAYEQLDVNARLAGGGLHVIASGRGDDGAIRIRQQDAALWCGRLQPGEAVRTPPGPFVHVFIADGEAELEPGTTLRIGDAARLGSADATGLTAGSAGAEVLIWVTA